GSSRACCRCSTVSTVETCQCMWASRWMCVLRRRPLGPGPWTLVWPKAREPMHKEVKYVVAAYRCCPGGVGRSRQLYGRTEISHAAGASAVGFACDGQYFYIGGLQQDRQCKKER